MINKWSLFIYIVSVDRPPAPVNVSVMHLRADSATVSWEVPEGDIIIGFSISQQVKKILNVEIF